MKDIKNKINGRSMATATAVLLSLISCDKEQPGSSISARQQFSAVISTESGIQSKTAISTDFRKVSWVDDDIIGIFGREAQAPVSANIVSIEDEGSKATFIPAQVVINPVFAVHPFSTDAYGLEENGVWVDTRLAGCCFDSANIMVATVSTNRYLEFKHSVGIFRIALPDKPELASILISGKGIAGKLHVQFNGDGSVTAVPDGDAASDSITAKIDDATSGDIFIPVIPKTYSAGSLSFTYYDGKGEVLSQVNYPKEITVSSGQIINWSDPVEMDGIRINSISSFGKTASFDKETGTFTLTLPTVTDFSKTVLTFDSNGAVLTANGKELTSGVTEFDAGAVKGNRKGEYIVNLVCDNRKSYKLIIRNTGLPVVRVSTEDGLPANKVIKSKDNWVSGITLRIDDYDNSTIFKTDPENAENENRYCQMKGRGNTTWEWFEKKPYAIKLEKKAALVGEKGKRWILLANFKDRTLLRNDAAFWISRQVGMPYTVRGRFVELEFNGEYRGNYYLCEQIKVDKKRVNITEMDDNEDGSSDPNNLTGGYLLEADLRNDEGANSFMLSYSSGYYYNIKDPDLDVTSKNARDYIKNYLTDLENSLKNISKNRDFENYLDIESAIDYFLVQELTSNDDFYNSGVHSTYLYKDREGEKAFRGGKICLGPVWDFDYSTFLPSRSNFWSSKEGKNFVFYYNQLMKDKGFTGKLVERWNADKNSYLNLLDYLDEMAEEIRLSEQCNHALWPQDAKNSRHNENKEANMTFEEALSNIKNGYTAKWNWIDKNIQSLIPNK